MQWKPQVCCNDCKLFSAWNTMHMQNGPASRCIICVTYWPFSLPSSPSPPPPHGRMDEWTIKTPNPYCRLFCKIDLLTDFAALYFADFIDWSGDTFTHGWYFWLSNYTCVLLPPYLLSDLPPPPPQKTNCTLYSIYRHCVAVGGGGGGGGGVELCCRPYSAGVLHSVSDQIQNLQIASPTPTKMTSSDDI